jgi:putative ABC transport system permease protein
MLRATLKSVLSRKLRLVLAGLAVVLGVMFVAGSLVLTDTLGRSFDALFSTVYAHTDVEVTAKPKIAVSETDGEQVPANLPASTVATIEGVDGVAGATGSAIADGARVIGKDGKVVTTSGAPRFGTNWIPDDPTIKLREGAGPAADNEVAIDAALAKTTGYKIGDQVSILTLAPKRTFTLVGIFGYEGGRDTLGGSQMVAFTEPVAQELMLGERGVYSSVTVVADPGVTQQQLRDRIAGELGDGYVVKTGEQAAADQSAGLKEFLQFFNYILLGFAGIALFVGVFLIVNTFSIIVAQRTRELALMRAIGASRRQMLGSVMLEAVLIGVVASALGLGAGIGVGALLAKAAATFGGDLEVAGLGVPTSAVIASFTVGILVTLVAALLPALRASRIPPIAALQEAATPDRPLTRVTVVGSLITAAGATLLFFGLRGAGDATLWTVLGGVLLSFIGVAFLTPLIARPVVGLIGRIFSWSVPGKLGRLNSGRNPRRTAITAAALMVGIALITGITTVLTSATTSATKTFENVVQADLVISGEQTGPRPPTFDQAVIEKTAALPGVEAAAAGSFDPALLDGERTGVVAITDLAALRSIASLQVASGRIDTLGPGQLVVDEQTAADAGVRVGRTVTVQFSRGEPRTLTVVGIYAENDLIDGWIGPASLTKDFGIPQPSLGMVKVADGSSVADVKAQVDTLLADSPEVSVADRSEYIEQQLSTVDTILTMIQILLALAILIAVLGVINTLALSVLERTRELGLLRAVGLRRGQTMRMVTVEAVVISVFGALLGVAVGAGLGAAVVRALRDEGITDLTLPWAQMGTYLGLAALIGVLAAVLPAIRAARTNVLTAIAYE